MPFDGSGNYILPNAPTFPAVTNTPVSSTYYNSVITDIATAINMMITRDGQGHPTANMIFPNNTGVKFTDTGGGNPEIIVDGSNIFRIWGTTNTGAQLSLVRCTTHLAAANTQWLFDVAIGVNGIVQHTLVTTVSGLPAAATYPFSRTFVTDSSVVAAGNFGAIVAGSGVNTVPVYSDGTNWRIG